MERGKCFGCQKETELCNSHIISEFFYKYVYKQERKEFFLITENNKGKKNREQKGYREHLLCRNCEEQLSKFEKYAADFFRKIVNNEFNYPKEIKIEEGLIIKDYNYLFLKRCLLSILWKASISSLPIFSEYNLGSYNTIIKDLVFNNLEIPWDLFPISISKIKFDNEYTPSIIVSHKKMKFKNKKMYSITLAGYLIDFIITDEMNELYKPIFLNDNFCLIRDIDFKELNIQKKIINRFNDVDVRKFFNHQ